MTQDRVTEVPEIADVLVLLPLARTYSYKIPDALKKNLARGSQVRCPIRGRVVSGLVTNLRPPREDDPELSELVEVVRGRQPWPTDLMDLLDFASRYYVAPVGVVARTALPSLFAKRSPKLDRQVRCVSRPARTSRSTRRDEFLDKIEELGSLEIGQARALVKGGAEIVRKLLADGHLVIEEHDAKSSIVPTFGPRPEDRPTLTDDQTRVLTTIEPSIGRGFEAFLLHGVTGSGKTEVYLRAVESALDRGRGAIVLVPEIALTVDLRTRFERRFGGLAAIMHSALPDSARVRIWDDVLSGRIRVVVGARSAIFAPMRDVGLIVVDEEHENTYKQQDGLRYNARDLALVRGKLAGATVILGSATPSLETFENTHQKKITYLSMPNRIQHRPLPEVTFVDLRYNAPVGRERLFSQTLLNALDETVSKGESAILFLNRRGFGRFLICRSCGSAIDCPNCSITLTHHMNPARLTCHYCDHSVAVPQTCPKCGSGDLEILGFGTERVEDEIGRLVKGARCARLDSDTATGGRLDRILDDFRQGRSNILVGTQIVAKGHDFPMVTLVGVLLAEQSLAFPDFRSGERTFQLLTQVAGRAGRGSAPGKVIVQTYDPTQYALKVAANHDFLGFSIIENRLRHERGYPPHSHLAAVEISSPSAVEAMGIGERVRQDIDRFLKDEGEGGTAVTVLGPTSAAIERIRGRSRVQILMKGKVRSVMNRVLWKLYGRHGSGYKDVRVIIDVDPVSLL